MRILFLSPSGQMGGAEAALIDVIASLREAEPDWDLRLIIAEDGPLTAKAESYGATVAVVPFPDSLARLGDYSLGTADIPGRLSLLRNSIFATPAASSYVSHLRSALREWQPDVIHTNGFKMHLLGALAKPRAVPLVWHMHDYLRSRQLMSGLMKLARARCSAILVNSHSVGQDVKLAIGNGLPMQTIHNGIDITVFSPRGDRLDLDALSGLTPASTGTIRVGLLATLARWKGHETFLRALSLIDRDLPLRAYIIGDALYQTDGSQTSLVELRATAERLGVSDRVGFTGFVAQPAAALRSLDVVVHASTEPEPFGLVIVEAMACARAVIMSDGGGAQELVERGVDALTHEPGNAEQLAERIMQLAADADLRTRLGAAGHATATERFDRTRLATQLVPLYESVNRQRLEVRSQRSQTIDQSSEPIPFELGSASTPISDLRPLTPDLCSPASALRVLHVHAGNMYGGVETMLLTQVRFRELCPALETSFALCFAGRFSEAVNAAGATVHSLGAVRISQPRSVRLARKNLRELLRRETFDAVVVHSSWAQVIFGPVARAESVPLVFYLHSEASGKHWLERWARRTTPDLVIANSQFTATSLPKLYPGVPAEVVYCPVAEPDVSEPQNSRSRIRAELNTPDDAIVIVQVSRMEAGKGHRLHLEALSRLQDLPDWVCWQVGGAQRPEEERYLEELKQLAQRLGLAARVRFLDQRKDVAQLLAAADIFCQPNTSPDSFGIAFAEAQHARLPVVTTDMGAAREIVDDSCGLLMPPANVHALADALRRLIADGPERETLGAAGAAKAKQLCDPGECLIGFYESIRKVIPPTMPRD
ncbi:MAG TPA: glycosyltransferase [Pyrinomonadaceae bacterium]|nr:glycosyltransferase [Pyrinomonadaceae bacterium]